MESEDRTSVASSAPNVLESAPIVVKRPGRRSWGAYFGGCLTGLVGSLLLFVGTFLAILFCLATSCSAILDDNDSALDSLTKKKQSFTESTLREGTGSKKVAVINVKGVIGFFSRSSILDDSPGGDAARIIRELRAVAENKDYAALILDMNTPGGEVVASDEIRTELDKLEIPVVTCMHSMAASGGYYIASGSDWIVTNPMTLTGSIGVILSGMQYKGLLDKIGVKSVVYRSGNFKDILNGARESTPEEEAYLNELVREDFMHFCKVVSDGRKSFYETPDAVAAALFGDGRPLSGNAALEYHLVDELGGFDDAVAKARELGDVPDAPVVRLKPANTFASLFLEMMTPLQKSAKVQIDGIAPAEELPIGNRFYLLPEYLR